MSIFRLIEGVISTRETKSPGYYAFDSDVQGAIAPGTDIQFDFGGMRKDVAIQTTSPVFIKFDSVANPPIKIDLGIWTFSEQYAKKIFLTTTVTVGVTIFANG